MGRVMDDSSELIQKYKGRADVRRPLSADEIQKICRMSEDMTYTILSKVPPGYSRIHIFNKVTHEEWAELYVRVHDGTVLDRLAEYLIHFVRNNPISSFESRYVHSLQKKLETDLGRIE